MPHDVCLCAYSQLAHINGLYSVITVCKKLSTSFALTHELIIYESFRYEPAGLLYTKVEKIHPTYTAPVGVIKRNQHVLEHGKILDENLETISIEICQFKAQKEEES